MRLASLALSAALALAAVAPALADHNPSAVGQAGANPPGGSSSDSDWSNSIWDVIRGRDRFADYVRNAGPGGIDVETIRNPPRTPKRHTGPRGGR